MRASIKKAREYVDLWSEHLKLNDWKIEIKRTRTKGTIAQVDAYAYDQDDIVPLETRTATIKLNYDLINSNKELSRAILHEMIHILFSNVVFCPTNELERTALERVVRTLEDAIWHFHLKAEE